MVVVVMVVVLKTWASTDQISSFSKSLSLACVVVKAAKSYHITHNPVLSTVLVLILILLSLVVYGRLS